MEKETNALVKIIETGQLDEAKKNYILKMFSEYFQIASEWKTKAEVIVVTDASQTADMKMAREGRLFLKSKRVDVEKIRKELKEQSLREGQTIDSIAKVLKNLIEPIEDYLGQQEDFVKIQEAKLREDRKQVRLAKLQPFQVETSFYDLLNMSDPEFDQLYQEIESAVEAGKKAEKERIAKEKAEAEESERIRVENDKLREEMNQIGAELEAKKKAEEEATLKAEEEAKFEAETEKKAQLAPDKEKIVSLIETITQIRLPEMSSEAGQKVIQSTAAYIDKLVNYLRDRSKELS